MRRSGEPVRMTARRAGACCVCGNRIGPGDAIIWWPDSREAHHAGCSSVRYRSHLAERSES